MNIQFGGAELTGMWFGSAGRLRLFKVEDFIESDYDWKGKEWAAHLRGRLANAVLVFDWWWDFSPERGGGYFFFRETTLEGEWWLGLEVDGNAIRRNRYNLSRNDWRYQRVKPVEDRRAE